MAPLPVECEGPLLHRGEGQDVIDESHDLAASCLKQREELDLLSGHVGRRQERRGASDRVDRRANCGGGPLGNAG